MKPFSLTALALALAIAFPAAAQDNAQVLQELRALKSRIAELEGQLKAQEAQKPQWGMTPDQARELNRVTVKTESLEDSFTDQGYKGLTIKGMIDPAFIWTRSAGGSFAFLNEFGGNGGDLSYPNDGFGYDNSYFGQAMLDLQKETEDGTLWRLTLAPQKNASSGYNVRSIVHEASVSLPLTDNQTRLWVGQIPDWGGYEYWWSHEQPLVTHNLLFDFTAPTFYTGAALDLTRGDWWTRVLVGNMNASRYDRDNRAPVLAYRVDYSRSEFDGWGFAGVEGKSFNQRIRTFEIDGYYMRGDWTLQGQAAIGQWAGNAADGSLSKWKGMSALVGYAFTPRLQGTVRADVIDNAKGGGGIFGSAPNFDCDLPERDAAGALTGNRAVGVCPDGRNGFGPKMNFVADSAEWEPDGSGRGANRYALSLGLRYLYGLNTTWKIEYRLDAANGNVFLYPDGSYRKRNELVGTSVTVAF
jgi:hypothetical protein